MDVRDIPDAFTASGIVTANGRGGWTWYTGSASWMYRVITENLLGIRQQGARLVIDPCIPKTWPGFEVAFRYKSARYAIEVRNPRNVSRGVAFAEIDGIRMAGEPLEIPLVDDGQIHRVRVILGAKLSVKPTLARSTP